MSLLRAQEAEKQESDQSDSNETVSNWNKRDPLIHVVVDVVVVGGCAPIQIVITMTNRRHRHRMSSFGVENGRDILSCVSVLTF